MSTMEEVTVLFESDFPASSQPSQLPTTCLLACLPCLLVLWLAELLKLLAVCSTVEMVGPGEEGEGRRVLCCHTTAC